METKNRWEDTGRDCPNCGGEILRRTDHLPDGSISVYNQCSGCEAQWTSDWAPLRTSAAEVINDRPGKRLVERLPPVPRWVWITLLAMVAFILMSIGGAIVFRLLIIPLILGLVVWLLFRLGQDQGWWSA